MTLPGSRRVGLLLVVAVGVLALVVGLRSDQSGAALPGPAEVAPPPAAIAATPELAARTVDRLQLLRTGNGGAQLRLSADEVTAVLRHALPGVLPEGIDEPVVRMADGVVMVDARLSTRDFVGRAPLAAVLGALPDTIDVQLRGTLVPAGHRLHFEVESAHAGHVPLPRGALVAIAAALAEASGQPFASSTEEASLSVPMPSGIALVAVVDDRLVLDRDEPNGQRAVDGSDDP